MIRTLLPHSAESRVARAMTTSSALTKHCATMPLKKIASPSTTKSMLVLWATMTPIFSAAFSTTGSGRMTRTSIRTHGSGDQGNIERRSVLDLLRREPISSTTIWRGGDIVMTSPDRRMVPGSASKMRYSWRDPRHDRRHRLVRCSAAAIGVVGDAEA